MVVSSACLPIVLMKYPLLQNSPPHSTCLTEGFLLKISRAVMLLIVCTTFFGLYVGTDCTKKCTWSLSVPISRKLLSNRSEISKHILFSSISTSSSKTTLRYFAGHTIMLHYDRYIMTLMDVFAHPYTPALSKKQSKLLGIRPEEIKI